MKNVRQYSGTFRDQLQSCFLELRVVGRSGWSPGEFSLQDGNAVDIIGAIPALQFCRGRLAVASRIAPCK